MKVNLGRYLKFKPTATVEVTTTSAPYVEVKPAHCYSCHELRAIGLDVPSCCESCHDDADSGHDLCEVNHGWSKDYLHVCCTVAQWAEEYLDNDEWFRLRRAREYRERHK